MITFIFRIAGESVKTVRAHCSRSAVCIRLCHPETETGCIPLQSDDDDSIQTAAWQTAVSHCGIDGGRKKKKIERERQMEQNRNGYFCNCRRSEISQSKETSACRRTFRSSFEENRWGGGEKQRKVFQLLCVVSGRSGRVLPRFIRCAHGMEWAESLAGTFRDACHPQLNYWCLAFVWNIL